MIANLSYDGLKLIITNHVFALQNEWNDFLESSGKKSLLSKAPNISAGVSVILASKEPQEIVSQITPLICTLIRHGEN
jgi:hypothetical protein